MLKSFKTMFILIVSIALSNDRGWVHPQTGWEVITNESMAFYLINSALIDNQELEPNQNDVIGLFF